MRAWARRNLMKHSGMIEGFCDFYKLKYKYLTEYHIRIEDVLDLYPVRGRYHILKYRERGHFETTEDLRKLMIRATQ